MITKKRITTGVVIAAIIALFLFWPAGNPQANENAVANVQYPDAWIGLGLLKLPGANVNGISGSNINDGVEFDLEMEQSVNDIGKYYERQLGKRDFNQSGPDDDSNDESYQNTFTSGKTSVTVNVVPDPLNKDRSRVRIWIERERDRTVKTNFASVRAD